MTWEFLFFQLSFAKLYKLSFIFLIEAVKLN